MDCDIRDPAYLSKKYIPKLFNYTVINPKPICRYQFPFLSCLHLNTELLECFFAADLCARSKMHHITCKLLIPILNIASQYQQSSTAASFNRILDTKLAYFQPIDTTSTSSPKKRKLEDYCQGITPYLINE